MKRLALALLLVLTLACGDAEPGEELVLTIDDSSWTREELDRYFALNLPVEGENDDLVRSALLDSWIDERVALQEARARELAIADNDLDDMIEDPEYEGGDWERQDQRRHLRERLLIELLQSMVLSDLAPATDAEVLEWAQQSGGRPSRDLRLRALRFDELERADLAHRRLRKNQLTFNEAVVQYGTEGDPDGVNRVSFETLPPEVQEVIEPLKSGWSSPPVEIGGNIYLFQVVEWIEASANDQLQRARSDLDSARRREAWKQFIEQARQARKIRVVKKNLPFSYVATDD